MGGIAIGLLISFMLGPGPLVFARRTSGAPHSAVTRMPSVTDTAPAHIAELLRTGRLMEAQDAYLEILVSRRIDEPTMRGLVAIRRRLSLNDPVLLRRQAEAYGEAAANGVEISGEHYTRAAMAVLAEASLRAAQDIENRQGQKINETSPP
jgi:hypothetical protein